MVGRISTIYSITTLNGNRLPLGAGTICQNYKSQFMPTNTRLDY